MGEKRIGVPELDLKIVETDSPLRYHMPSRERQDIMHVIDLGWYDGSGKCSCEHFEFVVEPRVKRDRGIWKTRRAWCWHIEKCRGFLCQSVINQLRVIDRSSEQEDGQ